jgi:predicted TIM-barrel fold metal-dependent hydrolase
MNIIDSHIHFGHSVTPHFYDTYSDVEKIEQVYSGYWGIVVMPFDTIDNTGTHEFVKRTSLNACFVAWLNPGNVHEANKLDFSGIKIHPAYDKIPLIHPDYDDIIKVARERKVPVTVHTGDVDYTYYWNVIIRARDNPDIKFIIGHMGGKRYQNTWQCPIDAKPYPNIIIDTTMKIKGHWIKHCADIVGTQRMIFGSDFPIMHPAVGVEAIKRCGIDHENVLFNTAKKLFWE